MSKFFLLITFIFLFLIDSNGQFKEETQKEDEIEIEMKPKKPPRFPGGPKAWDKYISENVEFPDVLKKYNASTTVYVEVIISRTGELLEPRVAFGNFDQKFNEQLITALQNSPNWEPAMIKKDSVTTKIIIPIIVK